MERLNKEGLAYYHSLIRGMMEEGDNIQPVDNDEITKMVLGDLSYEEALRTELDDSVSWQLNEIIYGEDLTSA